MKLKYLLKLKLNINNLNKIPIEELTEEIIEYALKNGFSYKDEVDDRYLKFDNYVLSNLKQFDEYKYKIINKEIIFNHDKILEYYKEIINNDIKVFLKLINHNINLINLFTSYHKLTKEELEELSTIVFSQFNYSEIPDYLKENNVELGFKYLQKNINNLEMFLYYNKYKIDNYKIIKHLINFPNLQEHPKEYLIMINLIKQNLNDISKEKIIKIIKLYPKIIEEISFHTYINFSKEILDTIKELIISNKYEITSKTPSYIINLINDNIEDIAQQKFDILFVEALNPIINDRFLYDLCIKNNYLLNKNSPNFMKKNILLVIESLKAHTISFDEIKLEDFVNVSTKHIKQLIELANLMKYEINVEIIKQFRKTISSSPNFKQKNGTFKINDIDEIQSLYIDSLDKDIREIEFDIQLKEILKLDKIDEINGLINDIKKYNRDIKLVFRMNYDNIYPEEIEKFIDFNYITLNFGNGTKISGLEILNTNKTVEIFVKDIKESNLSPLEKYIAVYNIVKGFKKYKFYNDSEQLDMINSNQSRSIYTLLNNEYIVCTGYVNLLEYLLKYIGIPATHYGYDAKQHSILYAHLKDEKYGIDTIVKSDPTNDQTNDILNSGYDNIFQKKNETPIDKALLLKLESLSKKDITSINEYLTKIFPEYKSTKDNLSLEYLIDYINYHNSKQQKDITTEMMINAILNIKEFLYEKKFTPKELEDKKKYLQFKTFKMKNDKFEHDVNEYKKKITNMKMSEVINKIQITDSYETLCIEQIINNDLYAINFSEELFNTNTRILCHNGIIVISIFQLSNLEKITDFLHEKNLIIPKEYNKKEYLEIDLSPIIKDLTYKETVNILSNFYEQINYYLKSSSKKI